MCRFACVVVVYLLAGALYQRFVHGAKGLEQLPNYEFWKDFGNLQAVSILCLCKNLFITFYMNEFVDNIWGFLFFISRIYGLKP